MATYDITEYCVGGIYKIPLGTTGSKIVVVTGGFNGGWGFDLTIVGTSLAAGTVSIYTQYTNPTGDTATYAPVQTYTITAGAFPSSYTREVVDSNSVVTAQYCIISWAGTDADNAILLLTGNAYIF